MLIIYTYNEYAEGTNVPTTRGNKIALAFMRNHMGQRDRPEITLFITTQQQESTFTIETLIQGLDRFVRGESQIFSRTDRARNGDFTSILLQDSFVNFGEENFDISVQDSGSETEQQKGFIITAEDPSHELTVYALSSRIVSADSFMAISCQNYPFARNYQYYIFSTSNEAIETSTASQFLLTPCEKSTRIMVRTSQVHSHPFWVEPSVDVTDPASVSLSETTYARLFNPFDTLMLTDFEDLTGTIITSDKPLAVFTGHQCGNPDSEGICDHLVEQIPPHVTYGDMFLLAPFDARESGEIYRIGSVSDENSIELTACECQPRTLRNNMVSLTTFGRTQMAVINRGEYVECQTPEDMRTFCSVESSQPVTVMSYTRSSSIDNLANLPNLPYNPIGDPSMVYIPPVSSYLSEYSLTSLTLEYPLFFSFVYANTTANVQSFSMLMVNEEVFDSTSFDIECRDCTSTSVCGQGGFGFLGYGNNFTLSGLDLFWGFGYGFGREISYAFPFPFKQVPIGRKCTVMLVI